MATFLWKRRKSDKLHQVVPGHLSKYQGFVLKEDPTSKHKEILHWPKPAEIVNIKSCRQRNRLWNIKSLFRQSFQSAFIFLHFAWMNLAWSKKDNQWKRIENLDKIPQFLPQSYSNFSSQISEVMEVKLGSFWVRKFKIPFKVSLVICTVNWQALKEPSAFELDKRLPWPSWI